MIKKKKMLVLVDGQQQEREVDYTVTRGKNYEVEYPVLRPFEHIYENSEGIKVFSSPIR
jgi:hypothetical protein